MLYYGQQSISDQDLQAVCEVLRSDLITTGPVSAAFETALAEYLGAKHVVVFCNATAALHVAMIVAGIGSGDRVVTTPNTFLASANCAAFVGATPDFVDIDPITYNLCPDALTANWKADTKAVVAVHYAGGSADMPAISETARANGAVVIEDACHAIGGSIESGGEFHKIGAHDWADMSTFSFHPVKTMTSGEGGALVTENDEYAARARLLRTHAMVHDISQTKGLGMANYDERGSWYYEMQDLGFNFRITDFQCALGLSQLSQLDQFISRRREIVHAYNDAFESLETITTPKLRNPAERDHTSWHLYTVLADFQHLEVSRTEFFEQLKQLGVAPHVLYIPVHLQPWYRETYGYGEGKCQNAERYYQRALSLPLYPGMSDDDVQVVIKALKQVSRR